jgi:hypothetical protein
MLLLLIVDKSEVKCGDVKWNEVAENLKVIKTKRKVK